MPQTVVPPPAPTTDPLIARIQAVGAFIRDNGFAVFVATVLLLWLLLGPKESTVSAQDIKAIQTELHSHSAEMTGRIEETKLWNRQMLQFAYIQCLRDAGGSQTDRDVCAAVLR